MCKDQGPNTGEPLDVSAASGSVGPAPPPPPPPDFTEKLQPYLQELVRHTRGLVESQQRMSDLVRDQAIAEQVAQAKEFRDTRETMAKLGDDVAAGVARTMDSSLRALVAAVTAHKAAPDPQVTQIQRDFAKANSRVNELEKELATAMAHLRKGGEEHQAEVAALREALASAEAQQAKTASDLMAKVAEYEQQGQTLMQRLLEQQSINEENARLIAALKLQTPGGPPTQEEVLQAQASGGDGPPPSPGAIPSIVSNPPVQPPPATPGAEPTAFVDQPQMVGATAVNPVAEWLQNMPQALKNQGGSDRPDVSAPYDHGRDAGARTCEKGLEGHACAHRPDDRHERPAVGQARGLQSHGVVSEGVRGRSTHPSTRKRGAQLQDSQSRGPPAGVGTTRIAPHPRTAGEPGRACASGAFRAIGQGSQRGSTATGHHARNFRAGFRTGIWARQGQGPWAGRELLGGRRTTPTGGHEVARLVGRTFTANVNKDPSRNQPV